MIRLFSVFIPTSILGLVISETLLITLCYLAAMLWQFEPEVIQLYLIDDGGLVRIAVVTATVVAGLYLNDCYTRVRLRSKAVFLQQLCLVIGVAFLLQAQFSYANMNVQMPRLAMLFGSCLCLVLLPVWRTIYSKASLLVLGAEKLVFVGTHPLQQKVAQYLLEHPEFAMKPIGVVVESGVTESLSPAVPILGMLADLPDCLKSIRLDRVIVGFTAETESQTHVVAQLLELQQSHYRTESMSDTFELVFGRVPIAELQPIQIVLKKGMVPSPLAIKLQAAYSWLIALAALVVLAPVMLVTALAVRLSSSGPVLFRQTRTGRNNAPFTLYKFRSMYADAEEQTGAVWAQENDPRVTRVGRVLRRYRLDELPQLFNVLRNEMAMVGPRPERPEFVDILSQQIPFYSHRHTVKPGITGWAQINYRYGNTIEDTVVKLEYDLYYIKHFSPQLDFYIMFHTAKIMLLTRGAY